jgi:hypothetical protein
MYDPDEEASWLYSTLAPRKRVGISCTLEVLTEIMMLTTCLVTLQFKEKMSYRISVLSEQLRVAMTDE